MSTDAKHILRIFVSHKDVNECPSLADAYNVIQEEADKINRTGLQRHLIEIQPQDYQIGRDLSNPQRGTFQSADSLKDDAYKAHAVFTLVDGDMSPRIRDWYEQQIKKVRKEAKERQIPMPIFWDTSSAASKANCEAFHRGNDSDYILKFNSLDEFRKNVASQLEQLSGRWATMINGGQMVPTLESNSLRRKKRWFISSLIFLAIAIAVYLLWPQIKGLFHNDEEKGPVTEIHQDTTSTSSDSILPIDDMSKGDSEGVTTPSTTTSTGQTGKEPEPSVIPPKEKTVSRIDKTVFISVNALTFESSYSEQLKSAIEKSLIAHGFSPSSKKSTSQYEIMVEAGPTDATSAHIIHLDVSIKIYELAKDALIYSDNTTYKDGSNSDEAAAMKIYRREAKTIGDNVAGKL